MNTKQREVEIEIFTEFLTDIRHTQERLENFESGDSLTTHGDLCDEDDFYEVRDFFEQWCEGHREFLKMEIQEAITGFLSSLKLDTYVTVSVS